MDSTSTTLTYNCRTKRLELGVRLTICGSLPTKKIVNTDFRLYKPVRIIANTKREFNIDN